MNERSVDVAIIGAGTAGLNARRGALALGKEVVLIEGGPYGTTCARVGCMPSKLLIAAAEAAHQVAGAGGFGVRVPPEAVTVDGPAVMDRVRRERDRFVGFVVEATEEIPEAQRLRGWARFEDPHTLVVDEHTRVRARSVVLATGSAPAIPPIFRGAADALMVNDDVFELQDLPDSIAVVGTGVIGLELGQALHRLGVRTAFFSHTTQLGPATDPVIQSKIAEVLGRELDLHLGVRVLECTRDESGVHLRWLDDAGHERQGTWSRLLAATGRRPNLAGLALDKAGVELDGRGVPIHDHRTLQCGASHIFIAGDATDERPLLHEAADEGRFAGENAARFPDIRAHRRKTPLAIVFTDPNIAVVGRSYSELDTRETAVGEVSYDNQGRSRVMRVNAGHVRLYGDLETSKLLGAEMFGPRVENTAHLVAWSIQAGLRVGQVCEMPYYHPVIEEGIRTGMRDLCSKMQLREAMHRETLEYGPGI